MTTKEIVEKHLWENGYDGLYSDSEHFGEDGCGCYLGDLFPCDPQWCDILECRPGVALENEDGLYIGPREEDE